MPKLCSLGYDYERTLAALEGAQERLTEATERCGRKVEAVRNEHWKAQDLLWRALRNNPGKTLLVGKFCYHLERDQIIRTDPWYGHEEWTEEPEPERITGSIRSKCQAPRNMLTSDFMATAWGTVKAFDDEADLEADLEPDCDDVDTEDVDGAFQGMTRSS